MAIKDLLWACPECAAVGALRRRRRGDVCSVCATRYRRARGATIEARPPDGRPIVLPAAEWAERLPTRPVTRLEAEQRTGEGQTIRQDRVVARFAHGEKTVRRGAEFLGQIERLGPELAGTLFLHRTRLRFVDDDCAERSWDLDRLTAVQPNSSTLQLKARAEPVVSIRFPAASARLWEQLLQAALQQLYHEQGRGEIVEFQPRIVTR